MSSALSLLHAECLIIYPTLGRKGGIAIVMLCYPKMQSPMWSCYAQLSIAVSYARM
jgi:hypothetical protein